MKIHELFESVGVVLSGEEREFVRAHGDNLTLASLDEHGTWMAQNLVRKGIYEISNDTKQLIKSKNVFKLRSGLQ
jgi:hypothetical protein